MTAPVNDAKKRVRLAIVATSLLSFLVVAIGVGVFLGVMSVLTKPADDMLAKLIGFNGHMFLQPAEPEAFDDGGLVTAIAGVPGIRYAMPIVENGAFASSPSAGSGVLVRGIGARDLAHLPGLGGHPTSGTFEGFDTIDGVAIGRTLAETLHVGVGDKITLVFVKAAALPTPSTVQPVVSAIFTSGLPQIDATFVLMPLAKARAFFASGSPAVTILAFLENPDDLDAVQERIETSTPSPLVITNWRERNQAFLSTMRTERRFLSGVVGFIVATVVLGLLAGLIVSARVWARSE